MGLDIHRVTKFGSNQQGYRGSSFQENVFLAICTWSVPAKRIAGEALFPVEVGLTNAPTCSELGRNL